MENKYYTPAIEEFYSGFEYEYLNNKNQWVKSNEFSNDFEYEDNPHYEVQKRCDLKTVRVKYLDQQDIESLGFITYDDTTFDKGDLQIRFNCLLQKKGQGLGLVIYDRYSGIIFTGYIKNKSELIKLFKQLDINE
jgi:hypothetical protein